MPELNENADGVRPAVFDSGRVGEQIPYPIEYSDIDGRSRSWRSGQRRLIYQDDLIEIMGTNEAVTNPGCFFARTAFQTDQILVENILNQGALSGTRHTGDTTENIEREFDVDIFEVVLTSTNYFEKPDRLSAMLRRENALSAGEISSRK